MIVYQSSILGDEEASDMAAGFERVLDIMLDPAIEMCIAAGEAKARTVRRWDMPVFVLNCLSYLLVCRYQHLKLLVLTLVLDCAGAIRLYGEEAADD